MIGIVQLEILFLLLFLAALSDVSWSLVLLTEAHCDTLDLGI
jgi:hypothetical protein